MNEELKLELIRKAGFHMRPSIENIVEGIDWNCGSWGYDRCVDKLIELVVLECDEFASTHFHDSGMTLGYKMKKHFGVNDES